MGGIKRTGTGLLLKKEGDRNIGSRSKEEQTEGHSKRGGVESCHPRSFPSYLLTSPWLLPQRADPLQDLKTSEGKNPYSASKLWVPNSP